MSVLQEVLLSFRLLVSTYRDVQLLLAKKRMLKPFPYDHFISLEQNRMMRFYRFANYFTDVPHLKGSVSRRAGLVLRWDPRTSVNLLHNRI